MAATYSKGSTDDTWAFQGNMTIAQDLAVTGDVTVTGAQIFAGDITLGNAASDVTIINGRLATVSATGSVETIDATTCQYSEGMELRYNVADWADTYTLTNFKAMYLRAETNEASSNSLYGAEVYGVANNVDAGDLKGILSYAYIKGVTAKTVGTAYGLQTELSWDSGAAATTITTEATPLLAKITGGATDDYTKIHGAIIRAGDMDGGSLTYGNGLLIEDDADMGGAITWTTGINLTSACTTGVAVSAATGIGVNVTMAALAVGDAYSGVRSTVVSAAANNSYGAAGYFDTTITGTQAGTFVYGLGSWVAGSATLDSTSKYVCAQDNGLYIDGSATITSARLVFGLRMEALIGTANAGIVGGELVFPFSINTQNNGITALFECMTASDLGTVASAGTDTTTLVPLFRDAGGNMRYVKLYTFL